VVIITSDHGESLGENRLIGHDMSLYNTVTRVPLIIRYPKRFKAGSVVSTPVQTVDIFPTLVDIIHPGGQRALTEIQGRSLLGLLEKDAHPFLISEYFLPGFWIRGWKKALPEIDPSLIEAFNRRIKSIERGDYKYIWYSDGRKELFNIKQDPYEEKNLIDSKPQIAAALDAELQEWLRSFKHRDSGEMKEPVMDEETRENLQALGYLY
jgi:arylsulfatase A-like enzyme